MGAWPRLLGVEGTSLEGLFLPSSSELRTLSPSESMAGLVTHSGFFLGGSVVGTCSNKVTRM